MKIRVPNSSMYINLMNAMGGTPVPLPFGETISAVQQGVVDGLEGNMNAYSTNGSAEVAKQMSFTNHLIGTCGAYINNDVWNSLPEEYRNIIQEEFTAGAAELTKFTDDNFQSTMEMLEKEQGCHFNDVDMDAFRAVMQVEYDRLVAEDGVDPDFIPSLQALVKEYDEAHPAA
jgi:TRAP-type C4-dicarboxylate transport system substrate-binding protein